MLKVFSPEWKEFIQKLEVIKTKSNREVLCIQCWQMLNCKQKIKHLKKNPDHEKYLLTSTKYASEKQMLSLARTQNKYYQQQDGDYVMTPYGPLNRSFRDSLQHFIKEETQNQIGMQGMGTSMNQQIFQFPQKLPLDNQNSFQKSPSLMVQSINQPADISIHEKIALMNQKLDSVVKILQMLVQQDLLVNQTLTSMSNSLQGLSQQSAQKQMGSISTAPQVVQPTMIQQSQGSILSDLEQQLKASQFAHQMNIGKIEMNSCGQDLASQQKQMKPQSTFNRPMMAQIQLDDQQLKLQEQLVQQQQMVLPIFQQLGGQSQIQNQIKHFQKQNSYMNNLGNIGQAPQSIYSSQIHDLQLFPITSNQLSQNVIHQNQQIQNLTQPKNE